MTSTCRRLSFGLGTVPCRLYNPQHANEVRPDARAVSTPEWLVPSFSRPRTCPDPCPHEAQSSIRGMPVRDESAPNITRSATFVPSGRSAATRMAREADERRRSLASCLRPRVHVCVDKPNDAGEFYPACTPGIRYQYGNLHGLSTRREPAWGWQGPADGGFSPVVTATHAAYDN